MVSTQNGPSAVEIYQERSQRFGDQAERFGRHDGLLVFARGLTFLSGVCGLLHGVLGCRQPAGLDRCRHGHAGLFLAFAILDDWLKRGRSTSCSCSRSTTGKAARCLPRLGRRARLQGDRSSAARGGGQGSGPVRAGLAVSPDQLAHTPRGMAMLRDWILEPATPPEIRDRQASVRELVPRVGTCGKNWLCAATRWPAVWRARTSSFTGSEGPSYLDRRPWVKWGSRLLAAARAVGRDRLAPGVAHPIKAGLALVVVLCAERACSAWPSPAPMHDIFNNISTRNGEMRHYLALFEMIASIPTSSPRLAAIKQQAVREEHGAVHQLRRLDTVMKLAGLRLSALSLLYFALQATVLWDFHVLWLLERWQKRCASLVRHWFDALGELEALSSLACLSFDNPAVVFSRSRCVACRDSFRVRLSGIRCCRTGAGGERCAGGTGRYRPAGDRLEHVGKEHSVARDWLECHLGGDRRAGLCTLAADSAADGDYQHADSGFVAGWRLVLHGGIEATEIDCRPGHAVCAARETARCSIFSTRSCRERIPWNGTWRSRACWRIWCAKGAIGAVSTHDLALAESPQLADCCQPVHFRETLHGAGSRGR